MTTNQEITNIIETLESKIREDLRPTDLDALYDVMLDDCYSFEKVGGPFAHMSPSRVLKEVDEVAYRCGKNDFEDSCGLVEVDGDYYERSEVEAVRDELVSELESRLEEIDEEEEDNATSITEEHDKALDEQHEVINEAIKKLNKYI